MKALCTSENLKKGVLSAEKIIGKSLTLPILSNILLEVEKGGIRISATNLEIGLVAKIRAKVEKEGKVAIPGRIAGGILSQLSDGGKINLEENNNTLKFIYNGNSAAIKGMDAKDFPIIPKPQSAPLFEISADDFQKKVGSILVSAATSDTRQELTGVYMEFSENKIIFATTDSFRLAEAVLKLKKEDIAEDYKHYLAKNKSVIIPARTISEVIRAISMEDGKIKVYLEENQIFFESPDILVVSRLIDGKYPEYKQVIPKEFMTKVILKKEDLLKATRLAGVFSDSKSREVKLKISDGKGASAEEYHPGKMTVFAESVEAGEGSWSVDCAVSGQGGVEVAFNNRYLVDGLNSLGMEDVSLELNDSFGPVMFREIAGGKPKADYFHIVMPIRS
ncbi:MAG: DNA polymerase III subunit beta [Candidatus Moranbacteria bacterium]|nr:DNA polymerase III subunit beta [Candidatus Moranbacteria bacterium]